MRFFEFETSLTVDEIQLRVSSYSEWEQHSSWNIFKDYTSSRKGLHLYPREHGFTGYYETGDRNRHYDLQRAKARIAEPTRQSISIALTIGSGPQSLDITFFNYFKAIPKEQKEDAKIQIHFDPAV